MIDSIQGTGPGATPAPRPDGSGGTNSPKPDEPPSQELSPELRGRLGAVADTIEELQRSLVGAPDTEQAGILRRISEEQVAFQNILSTDSSGESRSLESISGARHSLQPGDVLHLLE